MTGRKRSTAGGVITAFGALFIAAALLLTVYNVDSDRSAGDFSKGAAARLEIEIAASSGGTNKGTDPSSSLDIPLYELDPDMEMPTTDIDGHTYVGVLSIPALELELPVQSDWSYEQLRLSPCRYTGSAYNGTMVIAAHNYQSHFGRLKDLVFGDRVIFTDVDGNVFKYTVALVDVLSPYDVEELTDSIWPLSLFTCTYSGQYRVTIRCEKSE